MHQIITPMPKPKTSANSNIPEGFKVRVILPGAIIHLLTAAEPAIQTSNGKITSASLDIIPNTEHGDSIGFIDWSAVSAVSWRKTSV